MADAKKKYRNNLPTPEDTTLGGQKLLTPGFLRFVGELLFGERWQTPFAQSLGETRGKALSPATVHRWSMGLRSIPDWVKDALVVVLEKDQRDLDRRAKTAGGLAGRLRDVEPRRAASGLDWAETEGGQGRQGRLH